MAKLIIDNKTFDVTEGKNLLETCLSLGLNLPYFCWHPAMNSVGACRQCAVKMYRDESDTRGRIMMSCMEMMRDGLRISIEDAGAKAFREQVVEWLMTNHPHDCPVCDEGGSCHLQDMTVMTGHDYRRYDFKKRTYRNQYLGPFIHHEMNRCIQCYRCVRYYKDYAGGKDLDVFAAHNHVYFGREEDGVLQSPFSGNLAEVCPTGVFTDKTLKEHYTRKWDLTSAPSICMNCSLGCNILAGERYGELRLITNRYHPEVNGYFICDRGRFGYEYVNDENRIRQPLIRTQSAEAVTDTSLLNHIKTILQSSQRITGIGSSRASVESNFALQQLVGNENFYSGVSNNEASLLQYVLDIMRSGSYYIPSLKEVEQADAVVIIGEDITNTAPMLALSVRQALYKTAVETDVNTNIAPLWNDAAVRNIIQEDKGYLCIINTYKEELSELADAAYYASPAGMIEMINNIIADLGIQIDVKDEGSAKSLSTGIAEKLGKAKRPLIITGTGCFSLSLVKAATALADAIKRQNQEAAICFVVPESNSIGLAMMEAAPVESIFDAAQRSNEGTLIILENDLSRRFGQEELQTFIGSYREVIVLDSLHNQTTEYATVLVPAATFAEADGTMVNNEGRAQAFYKVLVNHPRQVRASWQWLFGMRNEHGNHIAVLQQLVAAMPQYAGIEQMQMHDEHINGAARIPMAPHRYSGRTAMLANISVHEPKPKADEEAIFSTTMEGDRQLPPSPLTTFYWWPGWNSVQSLNHYQREVGGLLKGEAGGVKLVTGNGVARNNDPVTEKQTEEKGLTVYPRYHVFGSDELSVYTKGVGELSPKAYVALNNAEAKKRSWLHGSTTELIIGKTIYPLAVNVDNEVPDGIVLVPYGIRETHGIIYPLQMKE